MNKVKKVPQRKCIACQQRGDKKSLVRIVKTKENEIFLDPSGRANGRGAYVCATEECLNKAIKSKALNRAFKMNVEDEIYNHLIDELRKINKEEIK
ncbi:RNase P modulator RnpM [Peptostreptococcus equinus]|uniref:YlxR family protein n=1 Tax=Peptostreptococcus equinus TaxID=3003601 RepID=A0ABY7JQL1_9FIRM|nr:YlxR family protein [Peptostreptococcus sp. CBA3647]WAW15640.1 YlxR family protein [Peptostreptococcus sp. CBA3647]